MTYPDMVYDKGLKSFRVIRGWDNQGTPGSIIIENGSKRGISLLKDKFVLRRFTGLLDKNTSPIYEGDLLSVGMRRNDSNGWTTEIVAWNYKADEWGLLDTTTGTEFMEMQKDPTLRLLTGQTIHLLEDEQEKQHLKIVGEFYCHV